jgi:predicted membrane protein
MASKDGRFNPALIMGVLAIAVGILILLDHAGFIHVGNIWGYWPVVLIILGLNGMFCAGSKCQQGNVIASGLLAFWGLMLLGMNFGYLTWAQVWPLALIAFGLLMVWQTLRAKGQGAQLGGTGSQSQSVFSSVEKTITDQDFKHAAASAVFGSVELDFIQANMAGDSAVVEANAVFGSVEIRVPITWNVVIEAGAVFGACENRTRAPIPTSNPKTLIVKGGVVFGSVEVKN